MLGVLKNLVHSEKFAVAALVEVAATVLLLAGKLNADQWSEVTAWVAGAYLIGKGLAGAGAAMAKRDAPKE